jgi:hypothetical protein
MDDLVVRVNFNKGIIKFGIILFLLFTFISFVYFFSLSLASNPRELIFERSEVDLTHACSYYLVYSKDIKNAIKTINISSIKEVYGNLKTLRIEVLVNESYNETVPIYGELFANLTCSLKNASSSWECYNNTCNCSILNISQSCLNLYSVNYPNDTCEYNYTGIIGYRNETKYRETWKLLKEYDVGEKIGIGRKIKVKKELFEDNLHKKGEDLYELRFCGEYDFTRTPNGWGVAIDHIPSFNNIDYTWLAWWNTSWLYRRPITINNTLNSNTLTDYQVLITLDTRTLISQGKMRSDCGDIRFANSTDYLLNYWIESGCNTTSTKIWVKVPNIPASSSTTIYVYYGNQNATSLSNGYATFDIFDDFEGDVASRWRAISGSVNTITDINGQSLRLLGPLNTVISNTNITSQWQFYRYEFKLKYASFGSYGPRSISQLQNDSTAKVSIVIERGGGTNANWLSGNGFTSVSNTIDWSTGTIYNTIVYVLPNSLYWSRDGGATTFLSTTGTSADVVGNRYIYFRTWDSGNDVRIDDLKVRKYTSPEPTYSVGLEEAVFSVNPIYTYDINLNPQTSFTNSSFIRIRTNVTHEFGASYIDKVLITIIDNSSTIQVSNATMVNISSINTNGYTYEYNYTLPSSPVRGAWTIKVYANDTSNNWASNQATFFVYLTFTPSISSPFNLNSSSLTFTQISQYQTFSFPHLISLANYISLTQTWQYRRKITINNTLNSNTLTDYQVAINLTYSSNMQPDFSDIRFTYYNSTSGTETQIPYWIENKVNSNWAYVWIKVPNIPASGYATIYVYYGNITPVTSLSNASSVFISNQIYAMSGSCSDSTNCGYTDNHNEANVVRTYSPNICTKYVDRVDWGSVCDNSAFNSAVRDYFYSRFRFLFLADVSGTYTFGIDSDDASEAMYSPTDRYGTYGRESSSGYPGETVIVSWYGGHGVANSLTAHTGTFDLNAGQGIWIDVLHTEWGGYEGIRLGIQKPGGSMLIVNTANFPNQIFARKYTSPEPTYSIGAEEKISYLSLHITFSSLVNLLTSSFTSLPLLFTSFQLTSTQISIVNYFTLPHASTLFTSITQPHTINIVAIPSYFSLYSVKFSQQFTLPSIAKTLTSISSFQTFSITAIPSLISSLIQIISPFNLIHIVSPEIISAYVTVYTPYGNTYGLNETVFVNGTIERKIGPISNARVDLYFYNTSAGPSSAIYWATTYTDNQGRYSFNWYNATKGNFTLQVRFVTSTGYYVANSTTVNLIDPITINDITPNWYYKDDERIFLTQIQNITVNRGIISIKPVSSQNDIAQLFYRQELNGLYTDCNNKDIGDNCWVVGRFRPPAGNLTFTTTYTVYYKLGNSYTFNFSKNISVTNVKDEAARYKVARFDYRVVGGRSGTSNGQESDACGSGGYVYYGRVASSYVSTIDTPPADYYVILIRNLDGLHYGSISYSVNGGSFVSVPMDAAYFYVWESEIASAIVYGSDIKNVSVRFDSSQISPDYFDKDLYIGVVIYAFNKTRNYTIPSVSYSIPAPSGTYSVSLDITSFNIGNDVFGSYYAGVFASSQRSSICDNNYLRTFLVLDSKDILSAKFNDGGDWGWNGWIKGSRVGIAENIYSSPGNHSLKFRVDYSRPNIAQTTVSFSGVMVSLTNDFSISYSIQSTKFPGLESRIRDIKPANIVWMGDTANISLNINSPTYSCNDVYVRLITPWKEYVQYLPVVNSTTQNVNFLVDVPSFPTIRGFGLDSFIVLVNSSNSCFGYKSITPIRLLPPKDVQVTLKVPDRVQAGGLFSVYTTFTPTNYSIFYPHIMLDLDGTFGFEVGTSSAKVQTGYTSGRCFDVTVWSRDYEPGVELAYTTTSAGTVFSQNSLRMVPQHMYLVYDKYGFLNIPKTDNYEIGKILIGYGIIQPGDWKMYGAYNFMINGFSAESGVLFSDYSLGQQFLYKFLDVTEVPQSFNIITNIGGLTLPVQLGTNLLALQWHNWIAFYPRNFPLYIYQSGSNLYARTYPDDPSTYWIPCLSSGYAPLVPPFNIYIEYIKTGDDAFTIPAGQRLAVIVNQWVDPWNTAEGVTFKAIAPLKPGIYNITVIVYDDAETGLYWTATKQVRVVSSLPKAQIIVSQEDFPAEEVWAKPYANNVTMIRRILVSNYQGFNDTQVSWYMNPLPIDAIYINGSMAGVIDYICDGCTVNPSNVTYVVPGVVYWLDKITYDKTYVDLGNNITGKVSFYVLDNSTTTDFKNVKVNITALVPYDAYPEKDILIIDRILSQQYLWYQFSWTSRTGYEVTWSISKPNDNYVYSSKLYFYNNNSKDIDVWYHIPLVRLPDFDARNIQKLTVDGENNIAFMVTTNELILTLKNMTQGEHIVYLEYAPYVAPPVTPVGGGGGGGAVLPVVKLEPKEYNYTGLPTNLTIWYKVKCENTACAVIVLPSGMYSSWVEIPHETKYGWTITGFLSVPKDGTITFPVYVRIPEATPDGYYNITIVAMDIGTRVEDRGVINIWISRKVKPIIEPYKIIAIAVLVITILLYINWEKVKKLIT